MEEGLYYLFLEESQKLPPFSEHRTTFYHLLFFTYMLWRLPPPLPLGSVDTVYKFKLYMKFLFLKIQRQKRRAQ